MKTAIHCRDCGAAVNVKTHGIRFADGGTDEQRERAWNDAQREWWQDANDAAKECGYDGASACGRSGGWCAPYSIVPGAREKHVFEDDESAPDFVAFAEKIEALYNTVPERFAYMLTEVIAEDAEDAAEEAQARAERDAAELLRKAAAARLRLQFAFPLRVSQRATDTPDDPGEELHAIIADAKGRARLSVVLGGAAEFDNARAAAVVAALNAFAEGDA